MNFKTTANFLLGKVPGTPVDISRSLLSGARNKCGMAIITIFKKYVKEGNDIKIEDIYFALDSSAIQNVEVFTSIAMSVVNSFSGILKKAGIDKSLLKLPVESNVFLFEINPQRINIRAEGSTSVLPTLSYEEIDEFSLKDFSNLALNFNLNSSSFRRVRNRWYRIPHSPINRTLEISGVCGLLPIRSKVYSNKTIFLGLENFVELRVFLEKYYKYLDIDYQNNSWAFNIKSTEELTFPLIVKEHYLIWMNELTNEYYIVELQNENITLAVPRRTFFEYSISFRILGEFNIFSELTGFLGNAKVEALLSHIVGDVNSGMLYLDKLLLTKEIAKRYD